MAKASSESFTFRVSDALEVPLRGHMLRLRLTAGRPSMTDLAPGRRIRLASPKGAAREVVIVGHSATAGRTTQARLEATSELDVVIARQDAGEGEDRVDIGWHVSGPIG
jgi:hypothetical protein